MPVDNLGAPACRILQELAKWPGKKSYMLPLEKNRPILTMCDVWNIRENVYSCKSCDEKMSEMSRLFRSCDGNKIRTEIIHLWTKAVDKLLAMWIKHEKPREIKVRVVESCG